MNIRAVVFDMDGLMFDSERIVQRSWTFAGNQMGYSDLGANIYQTLGFNIHKRESYFKHRYGDAFPFEEFAEYSRSEFRRIVDAEGLPVKPGLMMLLNYLKNHGYKIGIASSSSNKYVLGNLQRAGIKEYFDTVVSGEMVENGKPAPDIYLKACKLLKEGPGNCLAVEDAPNGICSAHHAGLRVIMVPDLLKPGEDMIPFIWKLESSLDKIINLLELENRW